ncbi:MAG: DMT family transporter [Actinobacteria bacterium]|nr:DMT family transporter [Actinomycetota bacterium]
MTAPSRIPWQAKFLGLALIWGSSFLLMKYGLRALEPAQIAGLRIVGGALTLLLLLRLGGGSLPQGARTWGHLFVGAIFLTSLPFTLFALGETRVSSALAGIGNSITPVSMVVFGLLLLPSERLTRVKLVAVLLGFIGVLVISEPWNDVGRPDPLGFAIVLVAGACYGLGWPYVRRTLAHADLGGLAQPTALLLCGTAQMLVVELAFWLLHRGTMRLPWSVHADASGHDAWVALVATLVLGVVGTGLAYMLQFDVVRDAGTVVSSTVTYLIPVVSVVLGVLVLGERIGPMQLLGFALVLGAALLVGRPAAGWASLLRRG